MGKNIKTFESFEKPEEKPRTTKFPKKGKACIGECDRQFYMEDGKPIVYCPSCDRVIRTKN